MLLFDKVKQQQKLFFSTSFFSLEHFCSNLPVWCLPFVKKWQKKKKFLGFTSLCVLFCAIDDYTRLCERFIPPRISRYFLWLRRLACNQSAEKDCRTKLWLVLKFIKASIYLKWCNWFTLIFLLLNLKHGYFLAVVLLH